MESISNSYEKDGVDAGASAMLPIAKNLILGFDTADDAAVYKITEDVAAVLTLDFFTPIVDDPYEFGAIAAANALSDVWAMGGTPLVALNILAAPCSLGTDIVAEIVRGGADKVREAGALVAGGHSIDDQEPKFGLSVFGTVNPKEMLSNGGAKEGDVLFYSKTIGSGIMNSALRAGLIGDAEMRPVIESLMELNKYAAEAMKGLQVHSVTDVTGFGLAGHLHEMMEASGLMAEIDWKAIPLFDRVYEFSCDYCRPAKTFGIVEWAEGFVEKSGLDDAEFDNRMGVLCDPQTSGGLLVAVAAEDADAYEAAYAKAMNRPPARVGKVLAGAPGHIRVNW